MHPPLSPIRVTALLLAPIVALLLPGCVSVSQNLFANMLRYEATPAPARFDAVVALTTQHNLTPEMVSTWKKWGNTEENLVNYRGAFADTIANDIAASGLFSRVVPPGRVANYDLTIETTDAKPDGNFALLITYTLADARTHEPINHRTLTLTYGPKMADARPKDHLPGAMAQIKESIANDLRGVADRQQKLAAQAAAELLLKAPLAELLVSSDPNVDIARARNRALVAAKTQQLPALLRDSKSADLTALIVRIEQTILDVSHEAEVAKDRAQQLVANGAGGSTPAADAIRDLALTYRERIELLKPIGAALKEELANRNR